MSQVSNNQGNFFGIRVSKPGINVNQASPKQLVYENDYSTTTWFDDSNSRVIQGKLPDGTYGMWVSPPGVDAATANPNEPGQLIFNSSQNGLVVTNSGSTTMTVSFSAHTLTSGGQIAQDTASVTVNHNLGYVPVPLVSVYNAYTGAYSAISDGSLAHQAVNGQQLGPYFVGALFLQSWFTISMTTTSMTIGLVRWANFIVGSGSWTVPALSTTLTFTYLLTQQEIQV